MTLLMIVKRVNTASDSSFYHVIPSDSYYNISVWLHVDDTSFN